MEAEKAGGMSSNKEIRTKFKLQFEAPGADETKKKIDKINQGLSPGKLTGGLEALSKIQSRNLRQMAALQKQVSGLSTTFKGLERIVDRIGRAMDKIEAGGGRGGGGGGRGRRGLGPVHGPDLPPGFRRQQAGDPSFFRGIVQGMGFGDFLPQNNKRGMAVQAGGNLLGRTVRGAGRRGAQMGGGLASMPFSGLQGLQTAAMGIPIVGGTLAGMLGQGAAAAGQNLSFQRSLIPLGGHLDPRGARAAAAAARNREMGRAITGLPAQEFSSSGMRPNMQRNKFGKMVPVGDGIPINPRETAESLNRRRTFSGKFESGRLGRANAAAGAARQGALGLSGLASAGVSLGGMNAIEANQFALGLLRRGGGSLGNAMKGGAVRSAMSAQTLFGAGPESTGAFLRGSRQGGMIGAKNPGRGLEEAIKDGMAAGMDTTEIREFLEQIAHAHDQFIRTGIPVNPKSIAMLAGAAAGTGMGVGRGSFVGQAVAGRAQQISQTGPQTAADFMLLQKMGGFQGGGLEGLESAMGKMENLENLKPEQFLDFVKSVSSGAGGGAAGRFSLRNVFQGFGAPLGIDESKMLQGAATGGPLSPEHRAQVAKVQKELAGARSGARGFGLERGAKDVMGLAGGARNQASIDNQLIAAGGKILPTIQNLERSQANAVTALGELKPTLDSISRGAVEISKSLPDIARSLQMLIDKLMSMAGGSSGGAQ